MSEAPENKPIFLAFAASYDDNAHGQDLPVAALLRINPTDFERLSKTVADMVSGGNLLAAAVELSPESFLWIKTVGLTSQGSLASIEGFFDSQTDALINQENVLEMDENSAHYMDFCVVYEHEMHDARVDLMMDRGSVVLAPAGYADLGHRQRYNFGGIYSRWDDVVELAGRAWSSQATAAQIAEPSASPAGLMLDATDKATVVAALTHYMNEGMGEPANRPEAIHELATGLDDSVVSMDDDGLADLIRRLQGADSVDQQGEVINPSGIFETKVVVRVLSAGELGDHSLAAIAEAISVGDCLGQVDVGPSVALSREKACERTCAIGSEPGFFASELVDGDDDGDKVQRDRLTA